MLFVIILIVIILISLAGLIHLFFRHLSDLKNIDVNSLPEERLVKNKAKIMEAKLWRSSSKVLGRTKKAAAAGGNIFSSKFESFKGWVANLEKKYQKNPDAEAAPPPTIDELIREAEVLINKEDFLTAEKNLIEVIARDKKNIKAYELLGYLYFNRKDYNQAEEVYQYLLKLKMVGKKKELLKTVKGENIEELESEFLNSLEADPQIAVYYDDLGQIYEITDKPEKAIDCYLKSFAVVPNNPKYIDKLIELSIKLGDKSLAKKMLIRLRQINPENGKIEGFKEDIEKM